MRSVLFQPWLCVEGGANTNAFQTAADWLDVSDFQSVVPYVEISNISGTGATLTLQTGPSYDLASGTTALYLKLQDGSGNGSTWTTVGVQTLRAFRFSDGQLPPAQYLRWWMTGTSAWSITFRMVLGLHERPGRGGRRAGSGGGGGGRGLSSGLTTSGRAGTVPTCNCNC